MRITKQPLEFTHVMSTSTPIRLADLPRVKHLHCRNGVFYLKRKVPAAAQAAFGKRDVWRSLNTTDASQAVAVLSEQLRALDLEFARARDSRSLGAMRAEQVRTRGETATKYFQEAYIAPLLARFEHFHLVTDDEERSGLSALELKDRRDQLTEAHTQMLEMAATEELGDYVCLARDILHAEKLIAPPNSPVISRMARLLLQQDIKVCEIQLERLVGRGAPTAPEVPRPPRLMPTMLDVFRLWSKAQTRRRTIDTYRGFVAEFEQCVGPLPCVAISREHAETLVKGLVERGCQRDTIKNYVHGLATVLSFGIQHNALPTGTVNVFSSIPLNSIPKRPPSEDRRSFELEELSVLFNSPVYRGELHPEGQVAEVAFWGPLGGVFQGGRIEELAQLRVSDVLRINGVWALRFVQLDPKQEQKNIGSWRYVPLHQELIQCGFLAYAASVKLAGHQWLFPSLSDKNKYGARAAALSKWFSRYLDSIGLVDDRLCFHSTRFSMKQQCTRSGIENEVRDALTGHWLGERSASRGYMRTEDRQYPFPVLVEAMKRLRYDELDLSHLHVQSPMEGVEEAFGVANISGLPRPVRRTRASARPKSEGVSEGVLAAATAA